jgi:hypothetical protein
VPGDELVKGGREQDTGHFVEDGRAVARRAGGDTPCRYSPERILSIINYY